MDNDKVGFFVVGAARSGTTSIYNYLSMHPEIFLPRVKECNFFSNIESLDEEVYKKPKRNKQYHMKIISSHKVYASLFSGAEGYLQKGEVSPSYLWDKDSAKRIYEYNPKAKIIISLRNPIHRAYSHYLMHFNTGYEKATTFEDAISAKKIEIWGGGNLYLEIGLYYEQIRTYFDWFDDQNIKILIYEDWIGEIEKAMNELHNFLGVNAFNDYDQAAKYNEGINLKNVEVINFFRQKNVKRVLNTILPDGFKDSIKRNFFDNGNEREEINPDTYKNLKAYYHKDISKLEKLIDKDLSPYWK